MHVTAPTSPRRLTLQVIFFTTIRTVINATIRIPYPFLAVFSRGMDATIAEVSFALAVSLAASALGPFIAPIADRHGRRVGMMLGLGIFAFGAGLVGFFPCYLTFLFAILLGNLGDNIFLPAMHAHLSDSTPYERRGRVLAITEMSWALSFIVLIPLAGLLIEATTWNTPFIILCGLGIVGVVVVSMLVHGGLPSAVEPVNLLVGLKRVLTWKPALIVLGMGAAMIIANEVVNIIFGVWMEDAFGLNIAALGAASMVVGFSELSGEGLGALFIDKVGKRRSIAIGLGLTVLTVVALPWLGQSLTGGLVFLFLFFLGFEYAIVATLPLATEVMPEARATVMAIYIAALSIGRSVGALMAPALYAIGFLANGAVSVLLNLVAILAVFRVRLQSKAVTENK